MPENPASDNENASILENPKKLWGIILAIAIPLVVFIFYGQNMISGPFPENSTKKGDLEKPVSFLPFASPAATGEKNSKMALPLDQLTAKLAMKLANNPDDVPGWTLLGRSYIVTGHPDKAIAALKKAVALAPDNIDLQVSLGEAWITASNGKVTPEAKDIFLKAEKIQADHPGVRYNLALLDFQAGEVQRAYDSWLQLAKGAPADARWVKELQLNLNLAAKQLGIDSPELPNLSTLAPVKRQFPSALTMSDVQGGNEMTQQNRDDFIRGMVQRLADRLQQQPDDLQGWLRLAQSYSVLGEKDKALSSYQKAMELAPDDEKIWQLYQKVKKG